MAGFLITEAIFNQPNQQTLDDINEQLVILLNSILAQVNR